MKQKVTVNLLGGNTLIFLAFFAAKITGYINWSWWWVATPLWLPFALVLFILVLWCIIAGAIVVCGGKI